MTGPRIGAKARRSCPVCGEPTTFKYGRLNPDEDPRWLCSMHDLNPRSPEELARIKANRKGWSSGY